MSDEPIKLTDEATEKLFGSIVMNFISSGEEEANVLDSDSLERDKQMIIMKSNTLFTVSTMYFMTVLQDKDLDTMRKVLTIWSTPMVQDLINIAFHEEIKNATLEVSDAIEKMEKEANGDASS
jgi:hypothetical protein